MTASITSLFGIELPVHMLFMSPTVAELTIAIVQLLCEQNDNQEAAELLQSL